MKFYKNTDNFTELIHVIEVTFQSEEFKGSINYYFRGNCKGINTLRFDIDVLTKEYLKENLILNDCFLKLDDSNKNFSMILKDDNENLLEVQGTKKELEDFVVGIKIKDCLEKE